MKVFILANGQPPSSATAQKYARLHDKVIVTDGAADIAILLGITPDIISGDFDSVENLAEVRKIFPSAEIIRTLDQDYGDLEKALLLAIERGATEITIAGVGNRLTGRGGGRVDHMLANYTLLLRYHSQLAVLKIVEDESEVRVISEKNNTLGELLIETEPDDRVSLIPTIDGVRVTITGVKWPLDDTPLFIGTRAISNEAQSNRVSVKVQGGMLFVCHIPGGEEKTKN